MYLSSNIKHIVPSLLTFMILLSSCEKYDPESENTPSPVPEPRIESFIIEKSKNPQLLYDAEGIIDNTANIISVIIDYDPIDRSFVPTIKIPENVSMSPSANEPIDGNKGFEYTVICGGKTKIYKVVFYIDKPLEIIELKINGTKAYFNEKTNTYIIPIEKNKWNSKINVSLLSTSVKKFYIDETECPFEGSAEVVPEFGKSYLLKLTKDNKERTYNAEFIGLPVVSLKADYNINGITKIQGRKSDIRASVYDPTDGGIYTTENTFAGIRVRGAYSSSFEKKSYSLEFRDEATREKRDVKLFGLRNDGDWILDGMVTDISRMRNRICTDLWNDVHRPAYVSKEPKALSATRGQMIVLYFNDEFRGMYCMTERVDRKQLKLDKENGYLYKAEDWNDAVNFKSLDSRPVDGNRMWGNFYQAEYPDSYSWGPLYDFIGWVCDNDDKTLCSGIEERFDIDNLVDYFLFINVIGADDNGSKNTFLGIYNYNGSTDDRKFFYCPWDMDGTLGRGWDMRKVNPGQIIGVSRNNQPNYLMLRVAKNNGAGFGDKVKARWNELKNGHYSKDAIMQRFVGYKDLLEQSGAYDKELSRWRSNNAQPLDAEMQYVDSWLEKHLALINKYFDEWDNNMSKL